VWCRGESYSPAHGRLPFAHECPSTRRSTVSRTERVRYVPAGIESAHSVGRNLGRLRPGTRSPDAHENALQPTPVARLARLLAGSATLRVDQLSMSASGFAGARSEGRVSSIGTSPSETLLFGVALWTCSSIAQIFALQGRETLEQVATWIGERADREGELLRAELRSAERARRDREPSEEARHAVELARPRAPVSVGASDGSPRPTLSQTTLCLARPPRRSRHPLRTVRERGPPRHSGKLSRA
jgi:hypothetical protein